MGYSLIFFFPKYFKDFRIRARVSEKKLVKVEVLGGVGLFMGFFFSNAFIKVLKR